MVYLDLILNLALLVALSVVSGFIDKRWSRRTWPGVLLQGLLFGSVAVIGMLRPLVLGPGLIFDGRSVMISLCALFFGPWAVSATCMMTIACRVALGGMGMVMGVLVILSSAAIGLTAYYRFKPSVQPPSMLRLYGLGLAVHLVMVALIFTLPENIGLATFKRLGLPVILLYPLATILAGKILADQLSNIQTLEALRESEKHYRLLFNTSIDAILLTAPDGRIIAANPAACRLFDWTEEELFELGRNGVVDATDLRLPLALEERDRIGKFNGDLTFIRRDGSKFEGEISLSVFLSREGKARTGMIIRDITERKRAESQGEIALEALQESEERYRSLVENANEAIYVAQDGMIKFMNRAGVEMAGYSEEEIISKPFIEFIYPDDRAIVRERYLKRLSGEELDTRYTFRFITKNGDIKWFEMGAALIHYEGRPASLNIVTDMTERKRVEEEIIRLNVGLEKKVVARTRELRDSQLALLNLVDDLNQSSNSLVGANQALEAVNKELVSFSYSVSHDLRAPLRSIDGFSQALLEDCRDKLDDEGKKYLERVRQATQNMGRLIDDMLNLSRVTQSEFRQEPVDLSKMFRAIADTNQQNNSLNSLTFNVQEGIVVQGDQRLMHIALTNLLDNAWKFAGKQEHPHIEFGAIVKDGKKIIFVRDNGVGFDMKYAGKLFGTFQRLHRFDEFPGTGVGLATVLRVMNRHGGRVWAESEVGKGATFFFTLPE